MLLPITAQPHLPVLLAVANWRVHEAPRQPPSSHTKLRVRSPGMLAPTGTATQTMWLSVAFPLPYACLEWVSDEALSTSGG